MTENEMRAIAQAVAWAVTNNYPMTHETRVEQITRRIQEGLAEMRNAQAVIAHERPEQGAPQ